MKTGNNLRCVSQKFAPNWVLKFPSVNCADQPNCSFLAIPSFPQILVILPFYCSQLSAAHSLAFHFHLAATAFNSLWAKSLRQIPQKFKDVIHFSIFFASPPPIPTHKELWQVKSLCPSFFLTNCRLTQICVQSGRDSLRKKKHFSKKRKKIATNLSRHFAPQIQNFPQSFMPSVN